MKIHRNLKYDEKISLLLTQGLSSYQNVVDEFENANSIRIVTYNISPGKDKLLDKLKTLPKGVSIILVTNIPARFDSYFTSQFKEKGRKGILKYLEKLKPKGFNANIEIYFNFSNHAKIIMTENVGYIGSANFSEESSNNSECGIIIRDKSILEELNQQFISELILCSSPYLDGKYSDQLIELKYYLSVLKSIEESVINQNVYEIETLIRKERVRSKLKISNRDVIELLIYSEFVKEVIDTISSHMAIDSLLDDIKNAGINIQNCCNYGSALDEFSRYNIERQILSNFENTLDDGEHTDEIVTAAQEKAHEKYEELLENVIESLEDLKYSIPNYVSNLELLIVKLEKWQKDEKLIDNTSMS